MGRYAARHALVPDQAIVSTASRTQETWYLFRSKCEAEAICRSDKRAYAASADDLLEIIRETSAVVRNLIVVGHNPGLWQLALKLGGEGEAGPRSRLKRKLPTAGLVVLEFQHGSWKDVDANTGTLVLFETPAAIKDHLKA